jgi:hypothetical protein
MTWAMSETPDGPAAASGQAEPGRRGPRILLPRRLTHSEGADDFTTGSHGRVTEPLATEDLAIL